MITVAEAHASSSATPSAFFARWADMATWPEWNTDTEWVRLDGPFTAGSTGVLKPKGGPKVKFVIATLVADREFTDVSLLAGARLTFRHLIEPLPEGGSTVSVTVTLAGPLGWFWNLVLGKGLKASLGPDSACDRREASPGSTAAEAGQAAPQLRPAQQHAAETGSAALQPRRPGSTAAGGRQHRGEGSAAPRQRRRTARGQRLRAHVAVQAAATTVDAGARLTRPAERER